jgi:hypothetical protein
MKQSTAAYPKLGRGNRSRYTRGGSGTEYAPQSVPDSLALGLLRASELVAVQTARVDIFERRRRWGLLIRQREL